MIIQYFKSILISSVISLNGFFIKGYYDLEKQRVMQDKLNQANQLLVESLEKKLMVLQKTQLTPVPAEAALKSVPVLTNFDGMSLATALNVAGAVVLFAGSIALL